MKDKIRNIDSFEILTEEQENLIEELLQYTKQENNFIIGITSQVGDGKTYLLNSFIYNYNFYNAKKLIINDNFAKNDFLIIVDDFDYLNYDEQLEISKKNKKLIFSYTNESKICINFKKIFLSHKNRINYLNIQNVYVFSELSSLSTYSFRVLKKINNNLQRDICKNNKINTKNSLLIYQKKIESIYENHWGEIKEAVINSKTIFPVVSTNVATTNIDIFLKNGWVIYDDKKLVFNNSDILIFLILRENTQIIKNWGLFDEKYNTYFDNSKPFQKSIISFLDQEDKVNVIENKNIFLSSIIDLQDFSFLKKNRIVFDLSSTAEVYKLLLNNKLIEIIDKSILINNIHNIVNYVQLSDDDLYKFKNSNSNVNKLIYIGLILINSKNIDYGSLRIFNEIEWTLCIEEFTNFFIRIKNNLNTAGLFFSLFLMRIIIQKNKLFKETQVFLDYKNDIEYKLNIKLFDDNLLLDNICSLENERQINSYIDSFFYFFNKSKFLNDTSRKLVCKFKKTNLSTCIYKNTLLKPFNHLLIKIYINITNDLSFVNWFKKNIENIYKGQYEGIVSKKGLFYKNNYNLLTSIKEAILLTEDRDDWKETSHFGRIIGNKVIVRKENEYWKLIKNKFKKQNFVTLNFDAYSFIESLIDENSCDKTFIPIYVHVEYNGFNKYTNNFNYFNNIILDAVNDDKKICFNLDESEFPLPRDCIDCLNYKILFWWNNSDDNGYIILSNLMKYRNVKYELFLLTSLNSNNHTLVYEIEYISKNNCISFKLNKPSK